MVNFERKLKTFFKHLFVRKLWFQVRLGRLLFQLVRLQNSVLTDSFFHKSQLQQMFIIWEHSYSFFFPAQITNSCHCSIFVVGCLWLSESWFRRHWFILTTNHFRTIFSHNTRFSFFIQDWQCKSSILGWKCRNLGFIQWKMRCILNVVTFLPVWTQPLNNNNYLNF